MTYGVGFIGTGDPDADGFAMAYRHANGYERLDDCEVVACADIVPENAERFAAAHGIGNAGVFEDYEVMLREARPEIVSVCVPPAVHAPAVIASVRAESVRAVHCEKPMAPTWGESRRMAAEARRHDVQLTFNHQRRFNVEWRRAKEQLDDGEIGELRRVETAAPNLFDWGTHCVDLCGMFVDEASPEWVLGGIDAREVETVFGVRHEHQGVGVWAYENGVHGLISTGGEGGTIDCGLVDTLHRLEGTDGVIEVNREWGSSTPDCRIRRAGEAEWSAVVEEGDGMDVAVELGIEHLVDALDRGVEPETCARNALQSTELLFGVYESARRRGRVDFPLEVNDHPLEAMLDAGDLPSRTAGE